MKLFREERLTVFVLLSVLISVFLMRAYLRLPHSFMRGSGLNVRVIGAVERPGDYIVERGATAEDAARSAGLRNDADLKHVDRQRSLVEDDLVYVPHRGERLAEVERKREGALKELRRPLQLKPIDINTADSVELQSIPGIGEKLAEAIMAERSKERFRSLEEVKRVAGIGEKKYKEIVRYATVSGKAVTEGQGFSGR
jgi:competence protein ComEA